MYSQIVSQEELSLVTLDEVKRQCRVFHTFEDDYLKSLIIPYSDLAQSYTNRMLTSGQAIVVVEEYCPVIQLPFGEVTAVTEVLIDDVATTDFTFNAVTQKVKIDDTFTEATIAFDAGYIIAPKIVKQAILMAINTAFVNRDDIIVGQTVTKMPKTSEDLLDRVKFYGT